MAGFPRSPRVRKGALVGVDPFNLLASVIVFQYNPETLTRTLEPQLTGEDADPSEVRRFKGPPRETIDATVTIDATDQLERGGAVTERMGIYPQLSALEMLVYPKLSYVMAGMLLAKLGGIEVVPPEAPLTLFVWGRRRVLPVHVTSMSINEEAYDASLNPIRANVTLNLRVLTYDDLPESKIGQGLYLAHQAAKEAMAVIGSASDLAGATGLDPGFKFD